MAELIDKSAAYKALKHEAETHMLPASREAYERSARIIDQLPTIEPELQKEIEQLKCDLKAYRSFYPMKNEVCEKCVFAEDCIDANSVEGKRFCSSFHAKLENEE